MADRRIAPALGQVPQASLIGFCSRDPSKARAYCQRHGASTGYPSLAELTDDEAVDAVYIASPNALHAPQAIQCLAAGKHVLVDKPLATTVDAAASMIDAARGARRCLGVMHQQRFHPANRRLVQLLRDGALGPLRILRIQIAMWFAIEDNWRNDVSLSGGGVLMDLGPHALDLMRGSAGPIAAVSAETRILRPRHRVDDYCRATLDFASGGIGLLELTYCAHHYGGRIEAYGDAGAFIADGSMQSADSYRTTLRLGDARPVTTDCGGVDCHALALADFTQAILGGREPTISAADGVATLEAVQALYGSARQEKTVSLPLPHRPPGA